MTTVWTEIDMNCLKPRLNVLCKNINKVECGQYNSENIKVPNAGHNLQLRGVSTQGGCLPKVLGSRTANETIQKFMVIGQQI